MLEKVDERELLVELAINMRYTMNSEKVNPKKMFNKQQEERKVRQIFNKGVNDSKTKKSMAQRVKEVNEYFRKKGANNE